MVFVTKRPFSTVVVFFVFPFPETEGFFDKLSYFHVFKKTNEITESIALETIFNSFSSCTFFVFRSNLLLI